MKITYAQFAKMIDASALKLDTSFDDFRELVGTCKKYKFGCAFIWPAYSAMLAEALKDTDIEFGTSLAFPSGQEPTEIKVHQARIFTSLGADQVDMVMNIGFLKSGKYDLVHDDIAAVREATKSTSLKVIIEAMLLTDEEITAACKIVADCNADYVKSGTGFSAAPTTLHHIAVMKKTVGNRCKIKAAGGVRTLDQLVKMVAMGVTQFGVGLKSSVAIAEEAIACHDEIEIPEINIEDYL
ncbi:MAG: deoxyribose-phosphate aldolase [Anaerolineaceae bacterium]|nr:deoxyribose-phosphate aldolase [Anaerolineaceae bacterium]